MSIANLKNLELLLSLTHNARIDDAEHELKKLQLKQRHEPDKNFDLEIKRILQKIAKLAEAQKKIENILSQQKTKHFDDEMLDEINKILSFMNH